MIIFYKNIIYLKKKYNLSLIELSEKANISKRTVENIIYNNVIDPQVVTANKLAKYFKVSLEDLVFEDLEARTNN